MLKLVKNRPDLIKDRGGTFATNCHRFYSAAITKISLLPQYRITDKLNCEACFHFT